MKKIILLSILLIVGCVNMSNPVIDDPSNPTLHVAKHLFYVDGKELLITEISNMKYTFNLLRKDDCFFSDLDSLIISYIPDYKTGGYYHISDISSQCSATGLYIFAINITAMIDNNFDRLKNEISNYPIKKKNLEQQNKIAIERAEAKRKRHLEYCNSKWLIIEFNEDKYGVTRQIKEKMEKGCANTNFKFEDNKIIYDYLIDKNIAINEIDVVNLYELSNKNDINYIIHGHVYIIEKDLQFKNSSENMAYQKMQSERRYLEKNKNKEYADTYEMVDDLISVIGENIQRGRIYNQERQRREMEGFKFTQAKEDAGTWVYSSAYLYNRKLNEKIYLFKNNKMMKLN